MRSLQSGFFVGEFVLGMAVLASNSYITSRYKQKIIHTHTQQQQNIQIHNHQTKEHTFGNVSTDFFFIFIFVWFVEEKQNTFIQHHNLKGRVYCTVRQKTEREKEMRTEYSTTRYFPNHDNSNVIKKNRKRQPSNKRKKTTPKTETHGGKI